MCLCFVKKPKKANFPQFERFLNFVPPKGLSLKSFFSSYSVFFLVFLFVIPFKIPFFLCFLSINPFVRKHYYFGFHVFFFFVVFPFPNVCLFFEKFLTSPSLNPGCFHFWLVFFSVVGSCVCLHGVRFCLSVSMLVLFLVFSCFVFFCLVSCSLSVYEQNTVFPAILVFLKLSWLKGSLMFVMLNVFVFVFCFLCCLFAI